MFKMKNTILAISLMPDHPDYLHRWVVGDNCDAIHFGITNTSRKAWYQPIVDGVSRAFYWADQIEKVYYEDLTVLSMEWTEKTIKKISAPPQGYGFRCVVVPLSDMAWTCKCGSVRFHLLRSGEIECSVCHKIQKFKYTMED